MIKYGDKQHFRGLEDDPELNYTLITLATDNGDNEIVLNDHYDQVIIENKEQYDTILELLTEAGKILGWDSNEKS